MQYPAVHGRVIYLNAALGHHFLQITETEIISQIPSNTQKDDRLIEMAAFEHRLTQLVESWKPISVLIDETFATEPSSR